MQQICDKYNLLVNDFYTKNGKWYFKNSNLNFSISHCDNFVAVAISDSNKISIDIEKISDKTTIIVKKYLDKKGIKYNNKRSDYFYAKKWTSLECKFKEPTLSGVFSCKKVHNNGEYLINTYCDKKIKIYKWK